MGFGIRHDHVVPRERGFARNREPHNASADDEYLHDQAPPAGKTASPVAMVPPAVTSA